MNVSTTLTQQPGARIGSFATFAECSKTAARHRWCGGAGSRRAGGVRARRVRRLLQGRVYSARLAGSRAREGSPTRLRVASLSSFGQDGRGQVYATSRDGAVYRIAAR
jgi:hypothetical protein